MEQMGTDIQRLKELADTRAIEIQNKALKELTEDIHHEDARSVIEEIIKEQYAKSELSFADESTEVAAEEIVQSVKDRADKVKEIVKLNPMAGQRDIRGKFEKSEPLESMEEGKEEVKIKGKHELKTALKPKLKTFETILNVDVMTLNQKNRDLIQQLKKITSGRISSSQSTDGFTTAQIRDIISIVNKLDTQDVGADVGGLKGQILKQIDDVSPRKQKSEKGKTK